MLAVRRPSPPAAAAGTAVFPFSVTTARRGWVLRHASCTQLSLLLTTDSLVDPFYRGTDRGEEREQGQSRHGAGTLI